MKSSGDSASDWEVRRFVIQNSKGLHARASAQFVRCAEQFNAELRVTRDGQTVPATSIMGLLMLAATCGSSIVVAARGLEANAALDALDRLIDSKFGEDQGTKKI